MLPYAELKFSYLALRIIYASFNDGFRYIFSGESPGIRGLNSLYSHTASHKFENSFPSQKKTGFPQWMLKYRRLICLVFFFFSVLPGFIFFKPRNFDVFDIK